MKRSLTQWNGAGLALCSAALFGVSTPLAKSLLPRIAPQLLAGLLYLGSGIGLAVFALLRHRFPGSERREAALKGRDWIWLSGAVALGGIVGPVLLMWGLATSPASTGSLLLNLEGVFTALLAWFVFKENFDRRIALGMALVAAGGICLSWTSRPEAGGPWGLLAIMGACVAWAVDNNLTRNVSGGDPVQIAMVKGLVAGGVNTFIAMILGAGIPPTTTVLAAGLLGFLGYGVSLVLFVLALRRLGTARTGAYFSTAPFVGAIVSVAFLGDRVTLGMAMAAVLMAVGLWLHLTEEHAHQHRHEPLEHEHLHVHDEHHRHAHAQADPVGEPHSHAHRHEELLHSHPHYPDVHHRHSH